MLDLAELVAVMDKHVASYGYGENEAFERVRMTYDCACGEWLAGGIALREGVEQDLHRGHVAQMIIEENKKKFPRIIKKVFDGLFN